MAVTPRAVLMRDGTPPTTATDPWSDPALGPILDEFIARWELGENPRVEEYLDRLPSGPRDEAIELIYREYCLSRSAGLNPDPAAYLARFPELDGALRRLFELHDAFTSRDLRRWAQPEDLPEAGDEIGTYILQREMGRGAFARVFLAKQTDLDDRLVVVKVSVKITPEHRLQARAEHPHIVEVFAHGTIDGGALQMIAMPFLGGATLATVLAERQRQGVPPKSGRDLLAVLDHVSASEYSAGNQARPSRDLLARLSYPRAAAWIVARLGEALDHAFSRHVAHGDVKPSNILLTASGIPMLLDFNLAVGWQLADVGDALEDAGGTLAYMAPERLQAVADPQHSLPPRASDRHRADIYALGMVLLETLTGLAPEPPLAHARDHRQLAAAYHDSRRQGTVTLSRQALRSIPLGLRPILARCLAPNPAERYARASELADDLDRWRTDRPLKHAREPFVQYALLRWPRRRRVPLAATFLVFTFFAALTAWNAKRQVDHQNAQEKLDLYWDHAPAVFRFHRFLRDELWRAAGQGNRAESELRHLTFFEVNGEGDWRERADFRDLSPYWRDELEIWLLEQALRHGQEIAARPDAQQDREVALKILERVAAQVPLSPLETQSRKLRKLLGRPDPPSRQTSGTTPPHWMDEYLRGVADERNRPRKALAHYESVLAVRPQAFWAHHRASHLNYRLGNYSAAVDHLRYCLKLRPNNPALYVQWAGCLYLTGRNEEAFEAYDKAELLDPNLAEIYSSRQLIRELTGLPRPREEVEVLDRAAPESRTEPLVIPTLPKQQRRDSFVRFAHQARRQNLVSPAKVRIEKMLCWELSGGPDNVAKGCALLRKLLAITPGDIEARKTLVYLLSRDLKIELLPQALKEVNRVLKQDPDDLWARFNRANIYWDMASKNLNAAKEDIDFMKAAKEDIDFVLKHRRFKEFIVEFHPAIRIYFLASRIKLRGNYRDQARQDAVLDQARQYAEKGLLAAQKYHESEDEAHYTLARVLAKTAKYDRTLVPKVADHLKKAFALNPSLSKRLDEAPVFDPIRDDLKSLIKADNSRSPP